MKIKNGYLPKITGRPASAISSREVVSPLHVPLVLAGRRYTPVVKQGQTLRSGDPLAEIEIPGGNLIIPSPYAGTVEQIDNEKGFVSLMVSEPNPQPWPTALAMMAWSAIFPLLVIILGGTGPQ